jgi:hypothetical protein
VCSQADCIKLCHSWPVSESNSDSALGLLTWIKVQPSPVCPPVDLSLCSLKLCSRSFTIRFTNFAFVHSQTWLTFIQPAASPSHASALVQPTQFKVPSSSCSALPIGLHPSILVTSSFDSSLTSNQTCYRSLNLIVSTLSRPRCCLTRPHC